MLRSTCLTMLLFAGIAAADVQTGVVRSGGVAIPGATVSAECGTDKITTTADDAGRFEMGGLPSTSCKYTVLMFGFEPVQKDAAASSTPLTFDLTLQGHATEPVAPKPIAPVVTSNEPKPVTPVTPPPAAAPPAPTTPDAPPPSMIAAQNAANAPRGRGGRGARGATGATGATGANGRSGRGGTQQAQNGRGGRAGAANANGGGFQNLSLVQNEDAPAASDAPASVLGNVDSGVATGDSFTVNGTLSQGVQAQAGDGLGMGGAGGFGFGAGGPGGGAFGADGLGGPGGDNGGVPGGRGGRGGAGGPGGPGGGRGGAAGFATGGAGGFGGGGGGGGRGGGGGGGGRGGAGGRGGRGPNGTTAFGNRAGRGRGPQWQASLSYNFQNSALNARPYDLASATTNGIAPGKPATANNQLGITLGGPIMIPKTKFSLRNSRWNVNITGLRNRTGVENVSSVPLAAFRTGDFSSILNTNIIYDPLNNSPFPNNVIPQSRLSPAAISLLNLYPAPTGVGLVKNYEFDASNPSDSNTFSSQISIPVTTKDRVSANLSAQSRNSANYQTFGYRDPTSGGGKAASVSYARTLQPTLVNTFAVGVNRNVTNNTSYFCPAGSNAESCASELGNVAQELTTPLAFGPPTLSFQNFNGLTDSTPTTNHSLTYQFTNTMVKSRGKHNVQFGLNFTRRESNSVTASGARGSYGFTGVNTQDVVDGSPQQQLAPGLQSGYDLADFLLGLPASGSVTKYNSGTDVFYYRQKSAYAFVNDDFRLNTKVTLNAGLRWEFYAPQTEKYNHMSNLAFSPDFTSVSVVTPGAQNTFTGGSPAPVGLIPADYRMFEPQIGIAAKPWTKRPIVIRAGYGIRYNGGALAGMGSRLAGQYPFVQSFSLTPAQAILDGTTLSLAPFPILPTGTIPNTYAVAPNYRPAMAQQWNAILQYTLGRSYVIQGTYAGIKGTDLDVLLGPNRATPGPSAAAAEAARVPIPYATTGIQYDESVGTSIMHSGSFQITRRLARGLGASATYTLAKAIDDSSTLGAGVVQNENNILAERAVTATVPHQTLSTTFNYQSLSGNQHSQFYWNIVRGWRLNGSYNVNSGTPFTATVSGDPTGTGITGSRANATGLPVTGGDCSTCEFFNTAAFGPVTTGTFGTAGRNTIPGIVNFAIAASASRSFQIGERHRLQLTFNTNNPLNHPSITGFGTVFGSNTFGLATRAGNMRTVSAQARFTF